MVGSRTVVNDDPRLDVRHVAGRSPLRVVLDREGITPAGSHVYDGSVPTLLFNRQKRSVAGAEQVLLAPEAAPLVAVLAELHRRKVRSVLVEGGAELLGHFIKSGLWDEAREIVGNVLFAQGTPAPRLAALPQHTIVSDIDRIHCYTRSAPPDPAWSW